MSRLQEVARGALGKTEQCELIEVEGKLNLAVDRRKRASAHTDPRVAALEPGLHDLVEHTIAFGLDGVEAGYEEAVGAEKPGAAPTPPLALPRQPPTRGDGAGSRHSA
jgi:hypothetical protein